MARFTAVPLADQGFIPTGPSNRVRWYVDDAHRPAHVIGPYASMEDADKAALTLNDRLCDECEETLDHDDVCPKCHVYHGDPCPVCERRGYHMDGCSEIG